MSIRGQAKRRTAPLTILGLLLILAGCTESRSPNEVAQRPPAPAEDVQIERNYDPSFPETPEQETTDSSAAPDSKSSDPQASTTTDQAGEELMAGAPVSAPPVESDDPRESVAPTEDPLVLASASSQAVPAPEVASSKPAADSTTSDSSGSSDFEPPPELPRKTEGLYDITFDHLKFDIEKDGDYKPTLLTDQIEELEGEKVRIRGYIYPTLRQSGITNFVLVRDNMECCFGPGAALFDCIVVAMNSGAGIEYTVRPVAVEGTFKLNEVKDFDGKTRAIFHLDGQKVK